MKIYGFVAFNNPHQMGYFAFYASAKSWLKVVDKLIVIDGWSSDDSVAKLKDWLGEDLWKRIVVVKNEMTYWDDNDYFHAAQQTVGWNYVIEHTDADWMLILNADYVYDGESKDIKPELLRNSDKLGVAFFRYKLINKEKVFDKRGQIINISLVKKKQIPLKYGLSQNGVLSDYPVQAQYKSSFIDPHLNTIKTIYKGPLIIFDNTIELECGVFGHFFFNESQMLYKCGRWANAISRYYGSWLPDKWTYYIRDNLYFSGVQISKDEIISANPPKEIVEVIHAFYNTEMLGFRGKKFPSYNKVLRIILLLFTLINNKLLFMRGFRGLQHYHKWVKLNKKTMESDIISLEEIYKKQNMLVRKLERWYS